MLILFLHLYLFEGRRVVAEFSGMAGLGGMGVGILAWCHQQIRYKGNKKDEVPE